MAFIWRKYSAKLASHPLKTKMCTSFSLMTAGDVLAQELDPDGPETWDYKRTLTMSGIGLCMHAPWFHFWYKWLDRRFAGKSAKTVLTKLPLDLCFAGPVYVSGVLCVSELARSGDQATCYPFCRHVFPTAYSAGVGIHAVFQTVNFRFVPSRQRILYDNATSLMWKTMLSFLANRGT